VILVLVFWLVAVPAWGAGVVSLNLCTDQLLVLLAPEQVAALEPLARDPALSFVAAQAASMPRVAADAEAVLRLHPDLVLAGDYGAQTTVAVLRRRGLRVVQLPEAEDFAAIEAQITEVANLLGVPARGAAMVADMRARLAALPRASSGLSALFWEARGYTAGPGSRGDAVLRAAGLRNEGTGGVVGMETLLTHPPDLLVTQTAPGFPSMATDLAEAPVLRRIRHLRVPPALLICGGPFTVSAADILAHGAR
jgi:iron complex transport system substrate-binding protein